MVGLKPQDKQNIATLYESEQYKSFKKLCDVQIAAVTKQLLNLDMSVKTNDRAVTLLQGQAKALEWLHLKVRAIHKEAMKDEG